MRTLSLVVLCLAIGLGGFLAGRSASAPAGAPASSARAIRHYACPMHPTMKSDAPGTAPCCGMALEPVYQGGGAAAGAAQLPPGAVAIEAGLRQLQGVKVGPVVKGASSHTVRLFGRVAPDETRLYSLNAAQEGSIQELANVTTGSFVKKDQRLGAFFSAEMRSALQSFITALDVIDLDPTARIDTGQIVAAGSTPNRNAQFVVERLRAMGMSLQQMHEVRRSRLVPLDIDIRSPADGLILARSVTPGQKFDKGAEWFRIANLDRVWILADLLEGDAPLARPGGRATVTIPGRAGTLTAVVSRVPPQFDPASRTLKVRLELDNPGALLRPDMYVDVELAVERPAALTVPVDAIVDSGLRRTVFVERGDGIYAPQAIETGWRAGDRVEVVSGLQSGDRIVLAGAFLVDSESQLRSAAAPSGAPDAGAVADAGAGPGPASATPAKDPVCGMSVDEARAQAAGKTADHQGRRYAFCSDACRIRFEAAPGTFTATGVPGGAHHDGHDHGTLQATAGAGARP